MSYNELRRDIFGQSDSQSAGIPYDDFKKSRLKPEADRQSAAGFGALGNVGVTAGKAAVNAGQVLVGAADTISDGRASQALSNVGYDPERTHQALDARYVQPAHEAEAGAVRSYAAIPFLKGTAGIGGAAGAGLEMLGEGIGNDRLQGVGRGLQDSAMRVQENLTQRQSQSAQEDAQKTIFGEDGGYGGYNFGTLSQQAFESLPGTIAMGMAGAPVAGAVTRGSAKLGVGKALSPLKGGSGPLSSAVSKGIDTAIGSGVGFGLSEGVFSGLSEAAGIQHEIRNTPVEDMAKHPMFAETFEQTSPDKPHEQRLLETREALARRAGDQTFARTALTTGLISGVTGGGVFGMLRGGTQTKGVLKNIWEGIKKEGLQQELPQSALEQLHGNMAKRDFVDESQRIFENVIEAGIQGGLVGAVMGGLGGGASVHPAQQIIQDVHQKNLAEHNGDQAAAEQATVETLIKLDRAFESAAKSPDESAVQPEPAAASIETGPETGPETGASMPKAQGMENPFAAIQTQADLKRRIIDTRDQIKKAGDKDGSLAAGLQQDEARFNELSSALDEWSNTDSGRQHQRQSEALKQSLNEGDIVRHALLGDVKVANIGRTLATVQTAAGEIANVPYGALLEKADAGLESSDIAASGTEAVTGTVEGLESSALGIPSASQPGPVAGTQNAGTPNQTDTTVPQDGLVPLDTQTGAV
ncbi:MAG: hypothetical protein IBX56_09815, partial [Methylomicrobium sp.]|nr:hypothetical protein [Methylomicrobium sp.]